MSTKPTLATVWLDGCSGCHMSFLDIDERLLELAAQADLVYSPLVDNKEFPPMVDITLIEGAVSSEEDFHKIQKVRAHTRILVSLGDCAVTANVPAMRNRFSVAQVLDRAYLENVTLNAHVPVEVIPPLRKQSIPVHQVVPVDVYIPGCPPSADVIFHALSELLAGRIPDLRPLTHFGS
jgi:NAD-reducing hydrogenase small subunit